MYDYGKSKGMTVIAVTISPTKSYFDTTCSNTNGGENSVDYIQQVNEWIMNEPNNVDYVVNTYDELDDGSGSLQSVYDSGDHLHLNSAGQNKLGEIIYNTVFIE
jgi:lysophospholipase L1-like esterase